MFDTADLRSGLKGDLDALRAGKISRSEARARAALARNILDTVKIEIAATAMRLETFAPVELESRMITVAKAA